MTVLNSKFLYDDRRRRCPRLGSIVHFGYCRSCEKEKMPCFKVFDCWWETFDVQSYFRGCLDTEAFNRLSQPPSFNKIASLMDLIHQAQASVNKKK